MKTCLLLFLLIFCFNFLNAQPIRHIFSDSLIYSNVAPISKAIIKKKKIIRIEAYPVNESTKDTGTIISYYFDTAANLIKYAQTRKKFKFSVSLSTVYDYKKSMSEMYMPTTQHQKIKTVNNYKGDSIIYSTRFMVDSSSEVITGYTTTYYKDRKLLEWTNYDKHKNVTTTYSYLYDENDLPLKIEETDSVGNLIKVWVYVNKYSNHGREMNFYLVKNNENSLVNRSFYNKSNQCIEEQAYNTLHSLIYVQKFKYNMDGTLYQAIFQGKERSDNILGNHKTVTKYAYTTE